jgi:mono/diheme cytochrome c family protein
VITLPDATRKKVPVGEIKSHTFISAMPPMGALLKESEIRDIISYLVTLK